MKKVLKKLWWLGLCVLLLDTLTKLAASHVSGRNVIIPGLLEIVNVRNTGIAFGIPFLTSRIMGIITAAVIAAVCVIMWKAEFGRAQNVGIMLLLSGGVGNMLERIILGSVQDFVSTCLFPFAVFNVADVAVVSGCIIFAAAIIFSRGRKNGTEE